VFTDSASSVESLDCSKSIGARAFVEPSLFTLFKMISHSDEHVHLVFSGTAGKDWDTTRTLLGLDSGKCGAPRFRLYIGDVCAARDLARLEALGITHIVNCGVADLAPQEHAPHPGFLYTSIRSCDANFALKPAPYGTVDESENPTLQWPTAIRHLRQARAAGTAALVHCIAGANRSVTTAAVYLTVDDLVPSFTAALKLIKAARPCANPMRSYIRWGAAACASWEEEGSAVSDAEGAA
jgi:hypothetical protein